MCTIGGREGEEHSPAFSRDVFIFLHICSTMVVDECIWTLNSLISINLLRFEFSFPLVLHAELSITPGWLCQKRLDEWVYWESMALKWLYSFELRAGVWLQHLTSFSVCEGEDIIRQAGCADRAVHHAPIFTRYSRMKMNGQRTPKFIRPRARARSSIFKKITAHKGKSCCRNIKSQCPTQHMASFSFSLHL